MTWLIWFKFYRSAKNGFILCRRLFGRWEVFVNGFHESSRYLEIFWRNSYRHLPSEFQPRRILMLGLAAGDNVRLLNERWPNAELTAVEWDPVMVRMARDIGSITDSGRPRVIIGDAAQVIADMTEQFDLILVDIFHGGKVAASVFGAGFYDRVGDRLAPKGLVMVNAFLQPASLDLAAHSLRETDRWKFSYNHMGIYRHR